MALIDNLLNYYKFDGDVLDAHGSNDGTNNGSTDSGTAIINNSRYFATNDNIQFADYNLGAADFSISFWIKNDFSSAYQVLWMWGDADSTPTSQVALNTDGTLYFYMGTGISPAAAFTTSGTDYSDNAWHMITMTWDVSSTTLTAFIDGSQVGTHSNSGDYSRPTAGFRIGSHAYKNEQYVTGYIDEVGIWTKVLTLGEHQELYASGSALAYPFTVAGTGLQLNIGDAWKVVDGVKVNIGDVWKPVEGIQINIGDSWKTIM